MMVGNLKTAAAAEEAKLLPKLLVCVILLFIMLFSTVEGNNAMNAKQSMSRRGEIAFYNLLVTKGANGKRRPKRVGDDRIFKHDCNSEICKVSPVGDDSECRAARCGICIEDEKTKLQRCSAPYPEKPPQFAASGDGDGDGDGDSDADVEGDIENVGLGDGDDDGDGVGYDYGDGVGLGDGVGVGYEDSDGVGYEDNDGVDV